MNKINKNVAFLYGSHLNMGSHLKMRSGSHFNMTRVVWKWQGSHLNICYFDYGSRLNICSNDYRSHLYIESFEHTTPVRKFYRKSAGTLIANKKKWWSCAPDSSGRISPLILVVKLPSGESAGGECTGVESS